MRYVGEELQFIFSQLLLNSDAVTQPVEIAYDVETEIAGISNQYQIIQIGPGCLPERRGYYNLQGAFFSPHSGYVTSLHL